MEGTDDEGRGLSGHVTSEAASGVRHEGLILDSAGLPTGEHRSGVDLWRESPAIGGVGLSFRPKADFVKAS